MVYRITTQINFETFKSDPLIDLLKLTQKKYIGCDQDTTKLVEFKMEHIGTYLINYSDDISKNHFDLDINLCQLSYRFNFKRTFQKSSQNYLIVL